MDYVLLALILGYSGYVIFGKKRKKGCGGCCGNCAACHNHGGTRIH